MASDVMLSHSVHNQCLFFYPSLSKTDKKAAQMTMILVDSKAVKIQILSYFSRVEVFSSFLLDLLDLT